MGILTNFGTFVFALPIGLNISASLLVGNSLGDNNPKQALQTAKMVMLLSFIGSLTIAVVLYCLKDVIPLMFTSISSVKLEISSTFFWFAISFIPDMWQNAL
jgi:Na+-driven multidrug efflux pump